MSESEREQGDERDAGVDLDVDVLFDGFGLLALDKPAGLAVLPGTGVAVEESLQFAVASAWGLAPPWPSVLGRLDRPTSGLIVLALDDAALRAVIAPWNEGRLHKDYLVVVHGAVEPEGVIDVPLAARRPGKKGRGIIEAAKTSFARLASSRNGRFSLVRARLHTGRTHQIRRHMKAIGHPVVGDPRYGDERRDHPELAVHGLMLHSWRLSHDGSDPTVVLPTMLEAPLPARMRALCDAVGVPTT